MQTRTIIDRIEIEPQTGNVGVRIKKQVVADNGTVLSSDYHRTMIEPGGDLVKQMDAVNAHLVTMGYAAITSEDMSALSSAMTQGSSFRAAKATGA
jgi:hypothetical protein